MFRIIANYIFQICLALLTLLSLVTNWYATLIISLILLLVVMILAKMGKGIVLRESTAFLYVLTCLVMPLVGYTYYTFNNPLARLWVKYMPVPEDIYFGFALPAIAGFCLAITWPLGMQESLDEGKKLNEYIRKIRQTLGNQKYVGIYIMVIGMLLSVVVNVLPAGLRFFATLFFFASFAGLLYLYLSPNFRYKKVIMIAFCLFIISNALTTGMFTIVAYMGITIFSFFMLGSKASFLRKVVILTAAVAFFIVLQNTKAAYRKYTWIEKYTGNKTVLFVNIFWSSMLKGDALLTTNVFFPIYSRTNQGFNVALVMRNFPSKKPHDDGYKLMMSFASALVPRFLWPDKPEAGGKYNMKYYTGMTIIGWSTNVGSLGEAYGSFGSTGGIIFMIFLGMFIRWAYRVVFIIGKAIPLLICWIPVLFYQITYSAETDTLQIMNSLLKTAFFILIIYKVVPVWFGKSKANEKRLRYKALPG